MGSFRPTLWLAAFLLLAGPLAGDNNVPSEPRAIFHLDLRALGAVELELPGPPDSQATYPPLTPSFLSFADNSTLTVSFPIVNPRTELSTRNAPQGGSHLFHTAVLDLSSLHVMAETSWGTAHDSDIVFAIARDRFLVRSGEKLLIVSRDWKQELEYLLPKPASGERPARVLPSPTGHTLFVISDAGEHREHVDVVGSETLTRLHAFDIQSAGLDAASDSRFAYLLPGKGGYALFELPLDALGKGALPPLEPLYFAQQGCTRPRFVTRDLLVLTGSCDTVTLIAPDGSIKAQHHLGRLLYLLKVTPSRDEQRFAVSIGALATPVKTEGPPDPVRVYDTSRLAPVSDLEMPPHSEEHSPRLDYTLSADGSLLAVLIGYHLSVYRLPVPTPAVAPAHGVEGTSEPESNQAIQTAVQGSANVDVALVNLSDLRHDAIQARVRITNHGTSDIALNPQKATLQVLTPKRKLLPALNPDKVAGDIRYVGKVEADQEWHAGCDFLNPYADCRPASNAAAEIRQRADAAAAEVRASALYPQTIKPGGQVEGVIFFAYQHKRGDAVLRVPVGDQIFEFPFPPRKR